MSRATRQYTRHGAVRGPGCLGMFLIMVVVGGAWWVVDGLFHILEHLL